MMDDPQADALDALLTALQSDQAPPDSDVLPREDVAFAHDLVRVARDLGPDSTFAGALGTRLRTHARRRSRILGFGPGGRRRVLWAAILMLTLLPALLLFPPVRADIVGWLQIGAVRILTTTPHVADPTPTLLPTIFDLAGRTTLADARQRVGFPILLPTYPPDLGPPPYVFVQDLNGPAAILVWTDAKQLNQARLSLHELSGYFAIEKNPPPSIAQTTVNGQTAYWTDGPYILQYENGDAARRLVTGHVLIWFANGITYRLETALTLDEAVRVAESLQGNP